MRLTGELENDCAIEPSFSPASPPASVNPETAPEAHDDEIWPPALLMPTRPAASCEALTAPPAEDVAIVPVFAPTSPPAVLLLAMTAPLALLLLTVPSFWPTRPPTTTSPVTEAADLELESTPLLIHPTRPPTCPSTVPPLPDAVTVTPEPTLALLIVAGNDAPSLRFSPTRPPTLVLPLVSPGNVFEVAVTVPWSTDTFEMVPPSLRPSSAPTKREPATAKFVSETFDTVPSRTMPKRPTSSVLPLLIDSPLMVLPFPSNVPMNALSIVPPIGAKPAPPFQFAVPLASIEFASL